MPVITSSQIMEMREQGRVVFIYARKLQAVVDGFKRYQITAATLDMVKRFNNGNIN